MPSYAKFLKDFSNKRILEYGIVALTEECSVLIQNKLPPKLEDSGIFFHHFMLLALWASTQLFVILVLAST